MSSLGVNKPKVYPVARGADWWEGSLRVPSVSDDTYEVDVETLLAAGDSVAAEAVKRVDRETGRVLEDVTGTIATGSGSVNSDGDTYTTPRLGGWSAGQVYRLDATFSSGSNTPAVHIFIYVPY